MEYQLKPLSSAGIEPAMAKVQQYRLLNEPWEAESICLDVLELQPNHQEALVQLLLSLSDQFGTDRSLGRLERTARSLLPRLEGEYERLYYAGVIAERRGKAQLAANVRGFVAFAGFREAMDCYEQAQAISPDRNDDCILRWNTCARVIMRKKLKADEGQHYEPYIEG